jgi:subtilisin family serine protease
MRRFSIRATTVIAALVVVLTSITTSSQGRRVGRFDVEDVNGSEAVAGEVLVKLRRPVPRAQLPEIAAGVDAQEVEAIGRGGLVRVRSRSVSAAGLMEAFARRPDVLYAEPNFIVRALSDPVDQLYPQLWGLKNTGQAVNGGPAGVVGADIRAANAWDLTVGSTANVVAILDTGMDYNHVDLAPNVWSAPSAFTVTVGGIAITCQAGTHGFNAITRTCDPMDDHNHGTHVAGTIGAVANNGIGVAGVNWVASMMALKFLDAQGSGTTADAIILMDVARQVKAAFASSGAANIRILSNSWGGDDFSQAFLDEVNAANDDDMLFVAAAGNSGLPNDWFPNYPSSYDAPNIIAVAATTNTDDRAYFSNYGKTTVHLGAPGYDILSTVRGNTYAFLSGTSMATPHVSGAGALALSYCQMDTAQLKSTLVDSVDLISSMATTTISGGRLNVARALQSCSLPPGAPTSLTALAGDKQIKLTWVAGANATQYRIKRGTSAGGPYTTIASSVRGVQYTDTGLTNGTTYYYVISAGNVLGESGLSNEASATPQAPADLTITYFTAPSAVAAGAPMTVSVTTKNQGGGPAGPSTTAFYLSANTLVDSTDTRLPDTVSVPALAPGVSSAAVAIPINVPSDVAARTYYVIAKTDADNAVVEVSKANNASARSLAVGPDLIVSPLSVPSTAIPGAQFTATFTVRNQGAGSAPASTVEFYWSTNTTVEPGDTVLGSTGVGSLGASATQQGQVSLTTPTGQAWGTYYVLALADSAKIVAESSEGNNSAYAVARIGGDLTVSSVTAPTSLGAGLPFTATDTTKNSGGSDIGPSVTNFYLSSDASLTASDPLLGSRPVDGLAAGAVNTGSVTLTVPGDTRPGTYYVFAKADGPNTLTETQESNNTGYKGVTVGPDLTVAIGSVSTVRSGSPATFNDTVTNRGGGDAGATIVKFFLSTNYILDGNDIPLAETRPVTALAPGASSSGSTIVNIPGGLTPAYYYLFAQADASGSVVESTESNNTYYKYIRVE